MGAEIKIFVFVLLKNAIFLLSKGSKINHNKNSLRDFIHFLNSSASHIFLIAFNQVYKGGEMVIRTRAHC